MSLIACIGDTGEPIENETVFPELAVQAFDEKILRRLTSDGDSLLRIARTNRRPVTSIAPEVGEKILHVFRRVVFEELEVSDLAGCGFDALDRRRWAGS